jgi:hypothetical protein
MNIRQIFSASGGYYGILDKNADVLNPPDPGAKPTGVLVSLDLEGNLLDTLTTFPQGGPVVIRSSAEGSFGLSAFSPPFEARPWASHIADCGGLFAISSGGREMKVEVWDVESSRKWLIENEFVGRLVTEADRERYFSQFGTAVRQRYDVETQIEIPERHPSIGFVRLTKDGYLWVKAGVASTSLGEVMWRVWPITPDSLGESFDVLLPANFTVQDSDSGIISGLQLDSLGREEIANYRLPGPLPDNCQASV